MTTEPLSEEKSKAASVSRLSIGTIVVVQLVLATVLLVSVNYLAANHYRVLDRSQDREFSLSNQTAKLLASSLVQGRGEPIRIVAAVRRSAAHSVRLRAILSEYARIADGMLEVEFVDPIRDADRALEIAEDFDLAFVEDVVIIDASTSEHFEVEPNTASETEDGEAVDRRAAHLQVIALEDMAVMGMAGRERRVLGYQDEDQLTSGIRRALEGKPRRFYFLADKSQIEGTGEDAPWEFLSGTFASLNIQLVPIRLSGLAQIPDDAAGIALVAPRYDLNERELTVLENYWARPRAALLVMLDPTLPRQPPNLRAFLRDHGVTPRANRLFAMRGGKRVYDVAATFTTAAAAGDLGNASTIFEGASSSLEIRENAEDLEIRGIDPRALVVALDGYQVEPAPGATSIPLPPYYLGASVSRGNELSDTTSGQTSRLVVLTNTNFLRPRGRHKEHIDFLRNVSNWLIGREELIGIGPQPVQRYLLNLHPAQISFANKVNLIFIPAGFLLIAAFVWNARRA